MMIALAVGLLGLISAAAAVAFAVRHVPPLGTGLIEHEPMVTKREFESLRVAYLEQRVEIAELRRREDMRRDARGEDLEQRRRRAGSEARHIEELPLSELVHMRAELS